MFRIDHSTAAEALPAPGEAGTPGYFTPGDTGGGVAATVVTADFMNSVQEELIAILAAASVNADKTKRNQVVTSLKTLFGGNAAFINTPGNFAAAASNAGIILIDATDGDITFTLPAASAANGAPLVFRIVRVDSSANACTIAAAAANTIDDALTTVTLTRMGEPRLLVSNGGVHWYSVARRIVRGVLLNGVPATSIPNSTQTNISWSGVVYDTDGIWSAANPTRLTPPAWARKIRITAAVTFVANGTGTRQILSRINNGAGYAGEMSSSGPASAGSQVVILSGSTGIVDVTPGDYHEIRVFQTSGAALSLDTSNNGVNWACLEILE